MSERFEDYARVESAEGCIAGQAQLGSEHQSASMPICHAAFVTTQHYSHIRWVVVKFISSSNEMPCMGLPDRDYFICGRTTKIFTL